MWIFWLAINGGKWLRLNKGKIIYVFWWNEKSEMSNFAFRLFNSIHDFHLCVFFINLYIFKTSHSASELQV